MKPGWIGGLLLLIVLNGFALKHWVVKDTRPAAWDQSIHTQLAFDYRDRIATEGVTAVLRPAYFNYPPLYHVSMIPALSFVDDVADAGAFINFFYLILLIVAVFLLGTELMGPWQGFTAAFLVSAYPLVFDMATQAMIDLALTAWVTLSILCLVKSENFSRMIWSIAFGVALSLGMLTKWTALAYILGPLIPAVWIAVQTKKVRWLLAALLVSAVITLPWYVANVAVLLVRIPHLTGLSSASGYALPGWMNLLWYPLSLFEQINLIFVLLLIPGLLAVIWVPRLRPLLLWFFVSMILFTIIRNHNIRYFMPALPSAALLSVAWLPPTRKVPFYLLNVVIAVYFAAFHLLPEKSIYLKSGAFPVPLMGFHSYATDDWKHKDIIETLQSLRSADDRVTRVLTVSNAPHLHSTTLNLSLRARGITNISFRGPSKRRWFEFADFVLLKTGNLGPDGTIASAKACSDVIASSPQWFTETFSEVRRWELPDRSEAILYKQTPKAYNIKDIGVLNISLDHLELPNITATGVSFKAVPINKAETAVGRMQRLTVKCHQIAYKAVVFEDVAVDLIEPQINLPLFLETQDLEMLKLKTLRPSATVSADAVLAYLAQKAKWLKEPVLAFEGSGFVLSGRAGIFPLYLKLDVKPEANVLHVKASQLKIAGIPLPLFLAGSATDRKVSLSANDEMPYNLDIQSIHGENGKLRIN